MARKLNAKEMARVKEARAAEIKKILDAAAETEKETERRLGLSMSRVKALGNRKEVNRLLDLPIDEAKLDDQEMDLDEQTRLNSRLGSTRSEDIVYRHIFLSILGKIKRLNFEAVSTDVVELLEKRQERDFWLERSSSTPRMIIETAKEMIADKSKPPRSREEIIAEAGEKMTEWRRKQAAKAAPKRKGHRRA